MQYEALTCVVWGAMCGERCDERWDVRFSVGSSVGCGVSRSVGCVVRCIVRCSVVQHQLSRVDCSYPVSLLYSFECSLG